MDGHDGGIGGRWFLAPAALLAGTALQLGQADLAPRAVAAATLVAGLAGAAWGAGRVSALTWRRTLAVALGVAVAAWAATELRARARLADALAADREGVDLRVAGRVAGLPQDSPGALRFGFDVDEAPEGVPRRLSLAWYRGPGTSAGAWPPEAGLVPGERWAFTLRLKAPHGTLNPHGFDLELWLFERGLRATGYVRASAADPPRRLAAAEGAWLDRLRHRLRGAIAARVPDARAAGVLAALVVGDQGAIELGAHIQVLLWRYL